jgi:hypothetical protein
MPAIRVLIRDMHPLLQSTVAAMLRDDQGITVLEPEPGDAVVAADVIIVSASALLAFDDLDYAPGGIVAIAHDISSARIVRFTQIRWPLQEEKRDDIGAAIRFAATGVAR